MTIEQLHSTVRILSNSCFVRWWGWLNYPKPDRKIAFCAIDWDGSPAKVDESGLPEPYDKIDAEGKTIYVYNLIDS